MTTSVESAARELAKIFGFNCKPEDNCAECPHHLKEAAEFLAAYATSERSRVIPPPHILKLYDRCCELEEHVAKHTLEDFEHCDICCENGEARKADIAYDNAVIGWVNGLCAAWLRSQEGK